MGGNNNIFRLDFPVIGVHHRSLDGRSCGMFPDIQPRNQSSHKFQGMKLRLIRKPDSAVNRKGERQFGGKLSRYFQPVEYVQFLLQLSSGPCGVNKRIFSLELAGNVLTERAIPRQSILICLPIHPGSFAAKLFLQLGIDQSVLRSDLRRGVPGHATTNGVCFNQQTIRASLGKRVSRQNPRQTSADHQHICFCIPLKMWERRKGSCIDPY